MTILAEKSLYERLGGHNTISEVISALYDRMWSDPRIWYYWKGHSNERKAAERRLFIDIVGASAGGPVPSKDGLLQATHAPLGVSWLEWWVFVELAAETLDQSMSNEGYKEGLFFALCRSKAALSVVDLAPSAPLGFAAPAQLLSQREKEVLRLVALGKNNSEIAAELFISVNTVTRHLTNIFAKTSTNNRVQAAVYAARSRIV